MKMTTWEIKREIYNEIKSYNANLEKMNLEAIVEFDCIDTFPYDTHKGIGNLRQIEREIKNLEEQIEEINKVKEHLEYIEYLVRKQDELTWI
jgi:hypothetical protein